MKQSKNKREKEGEQAKRWKRNVKKRKWIWELNSDKNGERGRKGGTENWEKKWKGKMKKEEEEREEKKWEKELKFPMCKCSHFIVPYVSTDVRGEKRWA